jgi:hypothetical protein
MAEITYPLTHDHLQAFGGIVQLFARFERLVEIAVSAILGTKYGLTAISMASLGYNAKCDVLLSLVATVIMDQKHKDAISTHVKDFNAFSGLRNNIAHHVWREGTKSDTIKPLSVKSQGGKGKVTGFKDDEPEYTVAELFKIGNTLIAIHDSFRDFLLATGFMAGMVDSTDSTNAF